MALFPSVNQLESNNEKLFRLQLSRRYTHEDFAARSQLFVRPVHRRCRCGMSLCNSHPGGQHQLFIYCGRIRAAAERSSSDGERLEQVCGREVADLLGRPAESRRLK